MRLNESDARAVDIVLNGWITTIGSRRQSDGDGGSMQTGLHTGSSGAASDGRESRPGAVSAMSDDLAHRVTKVDAMLKLLDYLPAEEPPATLVASTMRRIEEARRAGPPAAARAAAAATTLGAGVPGSVSPGIRRSPSAGGDEDAVSA